VAISLLNLPQFRKQALTGEEADVKAGGVLGQPSTPLNNPDVNPFEGLAASTVSATRNVGPVTTPEVKNYAFNPKYAAADQALLRKIANAGAMRSGAISQAETEYGYSTDEATRQRDKAMGTLNNRLASQGIYHSSIRADKQGDLTEDYTRYLDALSRKLAGAKQGAEFDYAGVLADIGAQREGLFQQQTEEETAARLAEAQRQAEAQAKAEEASRQEALMRALIEAENQRQAQYQAPSYGLPGGYSIGAPPPAAQPVQPQYKADEQRVTMPGGVNGMTMNGFANWVHNNLDRNASPQAVQAVFQQLMKDTPNGGTPWSDIAWLIQQYPNTPVSTSDVGGKVYGGRFF
jgi:hypothetical protein